MFIISIIINLIWNLEIYFLLVMFFFLFYNHPLIHLKLKPYMTKIFFKKEDLNKDYIESKLKTTI